MFYSLSYKRLRKHLLLFTLAGCLSGCSTQNPGGSQETTVESAGTTPVRQERFGQTAEGAEVSLFTLTNQNGLTVKVTNYGGIITSLVTPDRNGTPGDVVLGFDSLSSYLKGHPFFGAIAGRYANRIAKAQFTLDGQTYSITPNSGVNHIHGGRVGFDKKVWATQTLPGQNAVRLSYTSPDGEEGYPGTLTTAVTYTLTDDNELKIDYEATTDKATPVNLTNHSYFNLAPGQAEDALGHLVTIHADQYTVADNALIPTGELRPVKGTPLDFTTPHAIGERISQVAPGYDHNYVLNKPSAGELTLAATAFAPASGRYMEVFTTKPGVQFYTGNHLKATEPSRNNDVYKKHYGFCLETQFFPDSPNHPNFPSSILRPGEKYQHTTIYKFSTRDKAS